MKTLNVKIIGVDAPPNTNLQLRVLNTYYMSAEYVSSKPPDDDILEAEASASGMTHNTQL